MFQTDFVIFCQKGCQSRIAVTFTYNGGVYSTSTGFTPR